MRALFELMFRRRATPRSLAAWEKIGASVSLAIAGLILYRVSWDRDWFLWMILFAPATGILGFALVCWIAPPGFAKQCFTHYEPNLAGRVVFYLLVLVVLDVSTSCALSLVLHARVRAEVTPVIAEQARIIRATTSDPVQQLQLVQATMLRCVQYDSASDVWGREHVPTVAEILERRREKHWVFPRGDCKARAVYVAALLTELGIDWHAESSLLLQHVWISAEANGRRYDLGARQVNAPGDVLLQSLYEVAALRLSLNKLNPLWDPVATGEAPAAADAQRLGLVYRNASGKTITTDWKTDWSTKPRTADLPVPLKPNAGFPANERL